MHQMVVEGLQAKESCGAWGQILPVSEGMKGIHLGLRIMVPKCKDQSP